ncbi:MAG: pyridoxal phosphate-dependent aminotransferase [Chloroflexota bacterium]
MKPLSTLVESVPGSITTAMMQKGREMKEAGIDVVNLAGGEPDFDTAPHIVEAAFEAIRNGDTHYPTSYGNHKLLDAIVAKLARENNVHMTPDQIMVTPGGKWALYATMAAVINPGDEVMILDPSWVTYGPMTQLHRAVPVRVSLPSDDNFRISEDLLRAHVSDKTKMLMVNSPNNPTGRVLTRDEIAAIVNICNEFDLYLLSDEIYEHILYEGAEHHSPAVEPGMAERTIIVNGFSKGYAMTGWRLAWLAAPKPIAKLARVFQTQSITSAASFTMTAAIDALNGPQEQVHAMTASYAQRRRFLLDAFEEIPGIECPAVEGAFYLFPKFTNTDKSSLEIANILLEQGHIASTPGIAFGKASEGHIRFSFATHMDDLEKLVERMARIVPEL